MKNIKHFRNTLATNLIILISSFIFSSIHAQAPQMPRIGTTFAEVQLRLKDENFALDQWINKDNIQLKNEFLSILYTFSDRSLEGIHLVRDYPRQRLATAGLDSYLIYLERIRAAVLPIVVSEDVEIYTAMTEDAIYSISLNREKKSKAQLTVTIRKRESEKLEKDLNVDHLNLASNTAENQKH